MSVAETGNRAADRRVSIAGLNHVAIPVRDPAEAVRFWTHVMGAEKIGEYEEGTFAIVMMPGGFMLGFSKERGGWTARKAEYPHIGFNVAPEMMEPLKQRLKQFGVPSDDIWTRFRSEALMYFRDPSGNLFELYCHEGYAKAGSIPVGIHYGGSFRTDLEALNYDTWSDPGT